MNKKLLKTGKEEILHTIESSTVIDDPFERLKGKNKTKKEKKKEIFTELVVVQEKH